MKQLIKRGLSLFLAIMLIFTLSACGKKDITELPAPGQNSQQEEENTDTVTITDQLGRTVSVKKDVQRIVSTYYISSSLLIALGARDKLVGIEMKADAREIYKRAAPEFLELPAVGSGKGVNIEEIAKLAPDVVILPIKLADSVAQLEELNIPVIVINPETMDNFIDCVLIVSKAVGCEERGEELVGYYESIIQSTKEKTEGLDKPTVYLSAGSDYLSTCTSKMYQNDLIQMTGGENVSASLEDGYWQTISAEQLISWNPEYFFMVNYAEYSRDDILRDTRLADMEAVKNGSIFVFPSALEPWDYPTPSSVLGILWLTNKLHPEIYSTEDYVNEAQNFYSTYFNIEVTAEDLGL